MLIKEKLIKSLIKKLVETFGLELINETLAQICFEEANIRNEYFFDDLSERYEEINNLIKFRYLKK